MIASGLAVVVLAGCDCRGERDFCEPCRPTIGGEDAECEQGGRLCDCRAGLVCVAFEGEDGRCLSECPEGDCPGGAACSQDMCVPATEGSALGTQCDAWLQGRAPPDAGICDPLDESGAGCPQGQCCDIGGSGMRSCRTEGASVQDEPCGSWTDCACGHACLLTDVCAQWCGFDGSDDELCPGSTLCITAITNDDGERLGSVCAEPARCDPLLQDCDGEDEGCYVLRSDGTTDCSVAGDGRQGDPCTFVNDCASGFDCFDGRCAAFCGWNVLDCEEGACVNQQYDEPRNDVGLCMP